VVTANRTVESLELIVFNNRYHGQRVLVTGHTGFKGSWLCEWLLGLGAEVHGFALDPQPHETLFHQLGLSQRLAADHRIDVRNLDDVTKCVRETQPKFVFHLAAQPLVRLSFDEPIATLAVNVMGTANLLQALREYDQPCCVVIVTTDKCYENREWVHAYREEDPMGGFDPYSASKGCAELVTNAFRRSFFQSNQKVKVATARAGNVIGGGDWAIDRIVPDIFRALRQKARVHVRNRHATRPWQHVLEPLSGYLWLGALLDASQSKATGVQLTEAFNFGPQLDSNRTVLQLVEEVLKLVEGQWVDSSDPHAVHEAGRLNLAIDKAYHHLGWQPVWDFPTAIRKTVDWYETDAAEDSLRPVTWRQINEYCDAARVAEISWTAE
jgi:CDP-glucose 4,6-dehydratase